jgi:hypothetical protein
MSPQLILKRATTSRPSGEWNDDDFDVMADGAVIGRSFKANAAPVGSPWMWTLAFGHHEDRTPTHGYAETREALTSLHELACRIRAGGDRAKTALRRLPTQGGARVLAVDGYARKGVADREFPATTRESQPPAQKPPAP